MSVGFFLNDISNLLYLIKNNVEVYKILWIYYVEIKKNKRIYYKMYQQIKMLEKFGLIKLVKDEKDRRRKRIVLTEKGKIVKNVIKHFVEEVELYKNEEFYEKLIKYAKEL